MTSLAPDFAAELLAFLQARQTERIDMPVLQPADPFLDMAGESLRGRIFLTESETGDSLCLRPEFTIPVCRDHVASGVSVPRRYAYLGEVFRQRRAGGSEFFQAGIEDIGDTDNAAADARSLADALDLVTTIAPAAEWRVTVGDQAIFEAVVSALGLPRGWRRKLARAFGTEGQIESLIAALGRPRAAPRDLPKPVADALEDGDAGGLLDAVAGCMEELGFTAASGRSAGEIATRLIEQTILDRARLSPDEVAVLRDFLGIRVPLAEAERALRAFAGRLVDGDGETMGDVIAAFAERVARLAERGVALDRFIYDAAFGRPLDYYTGLVFEIAPRVITGKVEAGIPSAIADSPRNAGVAPVVGGGRYDRLLTLLGAESPIPGVGFSVWIDRLDEARITRQGARQEGAS